MARRKASRTSATRRSKKTSARPARRQKTRRKAAARPKARIARGRAAARKPARKAGKVRSTRRAASRPASRPAARTKAPAVKASARPGSTASRPAAPRSAARPARPKSTRPADTAEPRLNRDRRMLSDEERLTGATAGDERMSRAARTGRRELRERLSEHTEAGPELTGGDIDASWEEAYAVGDEAPGGDNPTPDQDRVDDIGRALGVEYAADEELKGADKITERDRHRWELDPASSEDWPHDRKREGS